MTLKPLTTLKRLSHPLLRKMRVAKVWPVNKQRRCAEREAIKTKVSIVLIGQFNPDSFLPDRLAAGKAISKKTAESAELLAFMPQETVRYKLSWAELLVVPNRLQISSLEAPHIRICDLVVKVLGELAPDSIVSQLGINVESHYEFDGSEARNAFVRRISPPEAWGSWGQTILDSMLNENRGADLQGGVMNVHMRLPFVEDKISGWRDVMVGPSLDMRGTTGVLIRSNHHQVASLNPEEEMPSPPNARSTSILLSSLSTGFEQSIEEALSIFDGVMK